MQRNKNTINQLFENNPIILAPMAGITNLPFRRIMKEFGAALVYTEMVSANGLIRAGQKTKELMDSHPSEAPLGIQLFGDNPRVLSQATAMIADKAFLIDINMGCPVKKVVNSGAGSALLKNPLKIAAIIKAQRTVFQGPLTIKIRSGWDNSSINYLEIGKIAEQEGVDAITLHPRTRSQGFAGSADWQQIAELKNKVNIPVFGSGDIFTAEDAINMLETTNCDAIMIGRGGYGNPWLLRQIHDVLNGQAAAPPTPAEKLTVAMHHLDLYREQFGDRKTMLDMRKHLCWYARGLSGASHFRVQLQQLDCLDSSIELTRTFFSSVEMV
jgi:nifR3 family TIM-barrel protein